MVGALKVAAHPVEAVSYTREHLSFEHPCILRPATLGRIYYERSFSQRDAGQATGHNRDLFSKKDIRPKINMPRFDLSILRKAWSCRKRERRLRDVISWIVYYPGAEFIPLLGSTVRPDQHVVAARFSDRLDHILVQVTANMLALYAIRHQECLNVVQDGIFPQVIADDLGHVRINCLIVSHSG